MSSSTCVCFKPHRCAQCGLAGERCWVWHSRREEKGLSVPEESVLLLPHKILIKTVFICRGWCAQTPIMRIVKMLEGIRISSLVFWALHRRRRRWGAPPTICWGSERPNTGNAASGERLSQTVEPEQQLGFFLFLTKSGRETDSGSEISLHFQCNILVPKCAQSVRKWHISFPKITWISIGLSCSRRKQKRLQGWVKLSGHVYENIPAGCGGVWNKSDL